MFALYALQREKLPCLFLCYFNNLQRNCILTRRPALILICILFLWKSQYKSKILCCWNNILNSIWGSSVFNKLVFIYNLEGWGKTRTPELKTKIVWLLCLIPPLSFIRKTSSLKPFRDHGIFIFDLYIISQTAFEIHWSVLVFLLFVVHLPQINKLCNYSSIVISGKLKWKFL